MDELRGLLRVCVEAASLLRDEARGAGGERGNELRSMAAELTGAALECALASHAAPVPPAQEPVTIAEPTEPMWPPAYSQKNGFSQDLSVADFAITFAAGAVFVHMRPYVLFARDMDKARSRATGLRELRSRVAQAGKVIGFGVEDGACPQLDEHGWSCIDDAGHDGPCTFPRVEMNPGADTGDNRGDR